MENGDAVLKLVLEVWLTQSVKSILFTKYKLTKLKLLRSLTTLTFVCNRYDCYRLLLLCKYYQNLNFKHMAQSKYTFFIFLPPSDSFCRSKSIFKFALPSQIEFIPLRATTPPQLVYNIHFIVIPCINSEIAQHSFSIIGFLRDILSVNQDCLTTFSRRSVKKCLQAILEI